MHTIQQVIRSGRLVTAASTSPVFDVARTMANARVGAIPIVDRGRLVGVFSERDLMNRVVVAGQDAHGTLVADVMTRNVVTASVDETRDACLEKMQRAGCRHLPVVEAQRVIAMLSMRDLLRDEIEERVEEIRELRAYIHQTPP